jgi:hypothetical protein
MESKVGFLETKNANGVIERSSSRLVLIILIVIVCLAAVTESATHIATALTKDVVVKADWYAIAVLAGTLLLGKGINKAAENFKFNVNNDANAKGV